jgi:hypothetical protein
MAAFTQQQFDTAVFTSADHIAVTWLALAGAA